MPVTSPELRPIIEGVTANKAKEKQARKRNEEPEGEDVISSLLQMILTGNGDGVDLAQVAATARMDELRLLAAGSLVLQVRELPREVQRTELIGLYQRHERIRERLTREARKLRERRRKQVVRGTGSAKAVSRREAQAILASKTARADAAFELYSKRLNENVARLTATAEKAKTIMDRFRNRKISTDGVELRQLDIESRKLDIEMAENAAHAEEVAGLLRDHKAALAEARSAQEALDGSELTALKRLADVAVDAAFFANGGESGGLDAVHAFITTGTITGYIIAMATAGYPPDRIRDAERISYEICIENGSDPKSARAVARLMAVGAAALTAGYDAASVIRAAATPAALRGMDPSPLYMLSEIGTKGGSIQHVVALTMCMLGFSNAEIRKALSEARGMRTPIDDAHVRRLTKPWRDRRSLSAAKS